MLKLSKSRRFTWPVVVERPVGGEFERYEFKAQFIALTREELEKIFDGELTTYDVLDKHLVGWEGVTDEDGNDVPCDQENKEVALNDVDVCRALQRALMIASSGEAERKNSGTPPVT